MELHAPGLDVPLSLVPCFISRVCHTIGTQRNCVCEQQKFGECIWNELCTYGHSIMSESQPRGCFVGLGWNQTWKQKHIKFRSLGSKAVCFQAAMPRNELRSLETRPHKRRERERERDSQMKAMTKNQVCGSTQKYGNNTNTRERAPRVSPKQVTRELYFLT